MTLSSENKPYRANNKSAGSGHKVSASDEHGAAHPTVTAVRIPADGALPYLITIPLVQATSNYHLSLRDTNLLKYSKAYDMRDTSRQCSTFLTSIVDYTQIDVDQLYDSISYLREKADWSLEVLENYPLLYPTSYGNGSGTFLNVPRAKKLDIPHLTFTHASLRLQPLVEGFWRSREAWDRRAFKRIVAFPREKCGLEMMTGEYHLLYTCYEPLNVRPNEYARLGVFGDAFVLKMASKRNKEGDWYYEDIPKEILHCSFGNQVLEMLKSERPDTWKKMVGLRGDGLPGVISPGTGLPGMAVWVYITRVYS